ncbi:MAG: hypothetical protein A2Y17_10775 [Clostridiales bacterium GWF2_38_85]|nr:MAG: hypothetical protein A2Y17_10775 [Clostridiales bacterium GWF2_38_85]HBL83513.1 hypothetical protein [Clostridiales bacterium]
MRNSIVLVKEKTNETSEYYKKLAIRISLYKYLLAIFIIVFIIYCFSNYKNEITIENFRYMLKFFDFSASTATVDSGQIGLDLNKDYSATVLRSNIAVADSTGLTIYDYNGKKLLKSSFVMEYPYLTSSSKYVYAYDLGGSLLKIYNTYSEIYSITYEYPFLGLTNNANGAFGVISSGDNYKSAIIVYDKDFRQVFSRYFGDSYTVSIALNKYGNRVLSFMSGVNSGEYYGEVYEFDITQEEPVNKLRFVGEMPLKVAYGDDNSVMVLTSKALRFYDASLNLRSEMFFSEKSPSTYHFSGKYAIMSYIIGSIRSTSEINIYDLSGNLVRTESFQEDVQDIVVSEDKVYVLTYTKLHIIDIVNGKSGDSSFDVTNEANKLLINDNNLVLISNESAVVMVIKVIKSDEVSESLSE